MRYLYCTLIGAALMLACDRPQTAAAEKSSTVGSKARELVLAAMQAEMAGQAVESTALLEQALQVDGDYAPAHWQLGHVEINGRWVKVEDAARLTGDDQRLAAYCKRRDALVDTADQHRELARWCRKSRLREQAELHWLRVLAFEPQDAEALAALKIELYDGQLMTHNKAVEARRQAAEHLARLRKWQPQILKWLERLGSDEESDRQAARQWYATLDDPQALGALIAVLSSKHVSPNGEGAATLVEVIGRMRSETSTRALLATAIDYADGSTKQQALEQLCDRPPHAVVPLLLDEYHEPNPLKVQTSYSIVAMHDGTVLRGHDVVLEDKDRTRVLHLDSWYTYGSQRGRQQPLQLMMEQERDAAEKLERSAEEIKRWSEHQQFVDRARNQRVAAVAEKLPEVNLGTDPSQWQKRWAAYTDSYIEPRYRRPSRAYECFRYSTTRHLQLSCFPAGTPVVTMQGMQPIETIRPGDMVLSQDVNSGELAFKCVQSTTVRPPADLLKLRFGSQELLVTRGHPFWVNGRGWLMAKQLQVGDPLHSLYGVRTLDAVEPAGQAEAHNLIVGDSNTYFVGGPRLLVHDNLPLGEMVASPTVPGMEKLVQAR